MPELHNWWEKKQKESTKWDFWGTYGVEDAGEPVGDKHVEAEKQNQHGRPVLKVSVVRTDSHIQYFCLFRLIYNQSLFPVYHFNIWKCLVFCEMFEWFNMWTFWNVSLSDSPPVKLSDDSAETKKSNNLEGAEQGADAVVIVVEGVEDIVGEAGEQVDQEPGL